MRNIIKLFERFRVFVFFILFQVLCFILILTGNNPFHRTAFLSSSNAVSGTLMNWNSTVVNYFSLEEQNQQLMDENARLKKMLLGNDITLYDTYKKFNDTIYNLHFDFIPLKIIGLTTHNRQNFLTINKGSKNGIYPDMGIVGTKGVIGFVINTTNSYATVKPIINEKFNLVVRHRNSKSFGNLIWTAENTFLSATIIDVPSHAEVEIGDIFETSGADPLFPEGTPVGKVLSAETDKGETYQTVVIELHEDFQSLYNGYAITNIKTNELNSLSDSLKID